MAIPTITQTPVGVLGALTDWDPGVAPSDAFGKPFAIEAILT
jgi:hypothetical protein